MQNAVDTLVMLWLEWNIGQGLEKIGQTEVNPLPLQFTVESESNGQSAKDWYWQVYDRDNHICHILNLSDVNPIKVTCAEFAANYSKYVNVSERDLFAVWLMTEGRRLVREGIRDAQNLPQTFRQTIEGTFGSMAEWARYRAEELDDSLHIPDSLGKHINWEAFAEELAQDLDEMFILQLPDGSVAYFSIWEVTFVADTP